MIDILLATYNGERYIRQQIHSLLSQTYTDWRLLIHDDGSTDETINIIKDLQKRVKFEELIVNSYIYDEEAQYHSYKLLAEVIEENFKE